MKPCVFSNYSDPLPKNCLVFFPYLLFGLGGISLNQSGQIAHYCCRPDLISLCFSSSAIILIDLLIFLLNSPLGYKVYDQLILNYLHCFFGARNMILKNPVFFTHLFIYRQEVFSTVLHIGYIMSIAIRLSKLAPKKESNL